MCCVGGKYVPPGARSASLPGGAQDRLARRVRGLLNRVSEGNLAGVVGEVTELHQQESRRAVTEAICSELLQVGWILLPSAVLLFCGHVVLGVLGRVSWVCDDIEFLLVFSSWSWFSTLCFGSSHAFFGLHSYSLALASGLVKFYLASTVCQKPR